LCFRITGLFDHWKFAARLISADEGELGTTTFIAPFSTGYASHITNRKQPKPKYAWDDELSNN